jgi:hypothetical protein
MQQPVKKRKTTKQKAVSVAALTVSPWLGNKKPFVTHGRRKNVARQQTSLLKKQDNLLTSSCLKRSVFITEVERNDGKFRVHIPGVSG